MTKISDSLIIEEYKQLHDYVREHEKAIGTLMIVMITASVTMLSAIGIFYFRMFSQSSGTINLLFSYLFLTPILVVVPLMSAIRGHRESLYKIGFYIKIFHEEVFGGAAWTSRLEAYQKYKKSESQDSVPYFAWIIAIIAYMFYFSTIWQVKGISSLHFYAALFVILPLLGIQHWRYGQVKGGAIEEAWRKAKNDMVKITE